MDELRIKSKFMRGIVSRTITKKLRKIMGGDVKVNLNDLQIYTDEKDISHFTLHIDGDIPREELETILTKLGI